MINSADEIKGCEYTHDTHGYPKVADEPALRLNMSFHGDSYNRRKPDQAWLVLGWNRERPESLHVWGPFRTQTLAREFGRRHFPRRYRVSGMFDPDLIDWYWH